MLKVNPAYWKGIPPEASHILFSDMLLMGNSQLALKGQCDRTEIVMTVRAIAPMLLNAGLTKASSETQGQSVGPGEKARRKFSSTGGKAPGYRFSPDHFQTVKRMLAPDWAQKMLCIIVPNWRTASPKFFSWVRTRRLLSRHICPVRSPRLCVQGKLLFSTFLTRNEGTTDESKKCLGCYQQEQFNLPREYSVFDSSQYIVNNRKFKMRRRRESQISNSLTRQNNNFARASRFFVHFFAVTARLPRENA